MKLNRRRDYANLSETDLAQLMVAGEDNAFTEIYSRYWDKLLAIAFQLTRDQVQSEEIVQEVFVSLWDRRKEFIIHSLSGYMATAVRYSVFKSVCRHRRRDQIIRENCELSFNIEEQEEEIFARFLKEYLSKVVEQLPEKCRLVFQYSRNDGMTIPEIANAMNISPKTAEAHLTKALKSIRLHLKDYTPLLIKCMILMNAGKL
ncbi:RNA polymerase sigma-70 factor [Chitinophaga arvensicola]|uniref:RNA polymerase sigma-70 factor, ECF subfamily n=1 Tax=Chitinophaga arvensicola TaxID=29529 RepID=A0A1I0S7P9_9BACT|nr:RNA polymerase sigma-70 factor [Chitinophaga arvensicola]SEW51859.1 RNA polymerase sigma-70 factor, ECF subfamily [Chitinophaga arvensicola]